jgi:hypothetical protein
MYICHLFSVNCLQDMEVVTLPTIRNTATYNNIYTWLRRSLLAIKYTINTFKIQETDLKYITHHTTCKSNYDLQHLSQYSLLV